MALKVWAAGEQLLADDLNDNFEQSAGVITVYKPQLVSSGTVALGSQEITGNTVQYAALVSITSKITVNKISIEVSAIGTVGTLDLTLYSEDGQTRLFNVTTASISAPGIVTTAVPAVEVLPGNYYIGVNPNGTAAITVYTLTVSAILRSLASEPITVGTMTITAGTPKTTFSPVTDITVGQTALYFRLDN